MVRSWLAWCSWCASDGPMQRRRSSGGGAPHVATTSRLSPVWLLDRCATATGRTHLQAKAAIDARRQEGQGPLSWADTIVLAAKVRPGGVLLPAAPFHGGGQRHAPILVAADVHPLLLVVHSAQRTAALCWESASLAWSGTQTTRIAHPCWGLQTTQELAWREDKIRKAADRELRFCGAFARMLRGSGAPKCLAGWKPCLGGGSVQVGHWPGESWARVPSQPHPAAACSPGMQPTLVPVSSPPNPCSRQGRHDCRRLWQRHPRAAGACGCHGARPCGPHPC